MHPNTTAPAELERELSANERLLWSGQPKQGLQLRSSDAFLIPFSLLWGGFAIFWEGGVLSSGAPFFFILWGIPFVAMGVYITIGRFFVDAATRAKTWYAVTNERILIISGLFTRTVKSLPLRTLPEITFEQRNDESGTITFGQSYPFASWYRGISWPGMDQRLAPAFDLVPNARTVYEIIRQAHRVV
jgi:Bacterial PH domain